MLTDEVLLGHDPGLGHPECPERLERLLAVVASPPPGVRVRCVARDAGRWELCAAHDPVYVDGILGVARQHAVIDHETLLGTGSVPAAIRAAGVCVELVEAILAGEVRNGFGLVRPPGHHASRVCGMGYCVFNNVAIATLAARRCGVERILVVDTDVHYGNGTVDILRDVDGVLVVSLHQDGLFPRVPGRSARPQTHAVVAC